MQITRDVIVFPRVSLLLSFHVRHPILLFSIAGMIHLPSIDAPVLEKAIQYFHYKYRYDNDPDNRPPFQVPPEMALDLMLVAHYLDT